MPEPQVLLRNRRAQPVELHLPGGVCVLGPDGQIAIDAALLVMPQLAWLLAQKVLDTGPAPGLAEAADATAVAAALHEAPAVAHKSIPKATAKAAAHTAGGKRRSSKP